MPLPDAEYLALLDALATSESRAELGRLRLESHERLGADGRLARLEAMLDAKLARLERPADPPHSQGDYDQVLASVADALDLDTLAGLRQFARAHYHGRMLEELDERIDARAAGLLGANERA